MSPVVSGDGGAMGAEEKKGAARSEKKAGDKAYDIGDYEAAAEHYNLGARLDRSDISFLMKLAKAMFGMKKDMECLFYCDKLIREANTRGGGTNKEIKKELINEAELWKGLARANLATCAMDCDPVITALEQCPSEETKDKLDEAKGMRKMFVKQERRNQKAAELRHEGRDLLDDGCDEEAKMVFTEAIENNPWDHKNFSYRAQCHINQDEFPEAVEDADRCIKLNPNFGEGYSCKAVAKFRMGNLTDALLTVADGLECGRRNPDIPGLLRSFTVPSQISGSNSDDSAESSRKHERDTERQRNELQKSKIEQSNERSSQMEYEYKVEQLISQYPQLTKKLQSAKEHNANLKRQLEEYKARCGELRPYFICPISQDIMKYPVIAADGFTYETDMIMEWFELGNTKSPMTREVFEHKILIPNHRLCSAIEKWCELRIKLWNIML